MWRIPCMPATLVGLNKLQMECSISIKMLKKSFAWILTVSMLLKGEKRWHTLVDCLYLRSNLSIAKSFFEIRLEGQGLTWRLSVRRATFKWEGYFGKYRGGGCWPLYKLCYFCLRFHSNRNMKVRSISGQVFLIATWIWFNVWSAAENVL